MPGTNSRRKGRRGAARRADTVPRPVVAMTPQESFERGLALHTDSTNIRGKFVGTAATTSSTPTALFLIQPSSLGARIASISSDYLRWRIKSLRIRFLGNPSAAGTGAASGFTSMGVLDDVNYAGEPPTSISGVSELRCSATTFISQTIPVNFEFRPLDKSCWYYCTSVSNDRFDSVGTLYIASSAASSVSYEVDFSIVFSGAFTVGAL